MSLLPRANSDCAARLPNESIHGSRGALLTAGGSRAEDVLYAVENAGVISDICGSLA